MIGIDHAHGPDRTFAAVYRNGALEEVHEVTTPRMTPLEWYLVALIEAAIGSAFGLETQKLGRHPNWSFFRNWQGCADRKAWLASGGLAWRAVKKEAT